MPDIIYVSKSRIERKVGPVRIAYLPNEPQPVVFSAHGPIAEYCKIEPVKLIGSHASTLDYVVAATGGGMLGPFGVELETRHINASNGKLVGDVTGDVGTDDGILVIRRIHLAMRLEAPESVRPVVARVHGLYAMNCPLYRTLHKSIELSSSYELIARFPN